MNRRSLVLGLVAVACYMASTAFVCTFNPPGTPAQGVHSLSVPFHAQVGAHTCGSANVQMWADYNGITRTQQEIVNWMLVHHPSEVGLADSLSPQGIAYAALALANVPQATVLWYVDFDQIRQALADQELAIDMMRPTIVITQNAYHAVILVGTSWYELATLQPKVDLMYYHDPADTAFKQATVQAWMSHVGVVDSNLMQNVAPAYQRQAAWQHLAEFDYWGGTYYGDPSPPAGCELCELQVLRRSLRFLSPLAWLGRVNRSPTVASASAVHSTARMAPQGRVPQFGQSGASQSKRRDQPSARPVPFPYGTTHEQIEANVLEAFRQTRLLSLPPWDDVRGELRVRRILPVKSLTPMPDYYLVEVIVDGIPVGLATIERSGLLATMRRVDAAEEYWPTPLEDVVRDVTARVGAVRDAEYVLFYTNALGGGSEMKPFATVVRESDGRRLYIRSSVVFAEGGVVPDAAGRASAHPVAVIGKVRRILEKLP